MQHLSPRDAKPALPGTDRLRFRLPESGDVDRITEICRDPDVEAWTTVPSPYTRGDAEAWIEDCRLAWAENGDPSFVVEEVAGGCVVGTVGVRARRPDRRIADIGYVVAPEARGRGLAPTLVRLVREWTLQVWPVERLEIRVYRGNESSERVAEKCGFTREGVLGQFGEQRGVLRDVVMFAWFPTDTAAGG